MWAKRPVKSRVITLIGLLLVATGCVSRPSSALPTVLPPATESPSATSAATAQPATPTALPTAVPPTPTLPPQTPTLPSPTLPPGQSDGPCFSKATFVADVTIPDNTSVVPGSSFVKTWRLRNDGTCTWGSNGYAVHALLFVGGNRLGGPASVPLPPVVRPGDTVDVSVNLLAPIAAGIYKSEWMLANNNGAPIGVGRDGATPLYAQIVVGATPTPIVDGSCSYRATFVADITIPDNTVIAPGSAFVKTWRLRNDGTCTWGSNGYALHALAFFGGDKLSGPDSVELPGEIPPGSTVDISVNLKAPANPGIYRSEWKLLNTQGPMLGVGAQGTRPLYVQIVVGTPTVPIPATRTRINFAPGNASTTFTTNLAAGAAQGYVLQVLGGQQLYVSATGNATVGVLDPSDIPMAIQRAGRPGLWIVGIPVTGDYTVVVYGDGVSTVTIYVPPL